MDENGGGGPHDANSSELFSWQQPTSACGASLWMKNRAYVRQCWTGYFHGFRTPAPDQACPSRRGPASETLPMSTDARFQKHHKQSDLPKSRRTPRLSTLPNQHVPARSPFGTTLPLHAQNGDRAWHSEPGGLPASPRRTTQVRHLLALAAIYDGRRVQRRPRSAP